MRFSCADWWEGRVGGWFLIEDVLDDLGVAVGEEAVDAESFVDAVVLGRGNGEDGVGG